MSIGKSNTNQPLYPIPLTPRETLYTWRWFFFNGSDLFYKIHKDSQPKIYIKKENYLTIWVKHISVPIHDFNEKYDLLSIYPTKLKTKT